MVELAKNEKETIIIFNEEEQEAEIYTYNRALKTKMEQYCKDFPESFTRVGEEEGASEYRCPKHFISIRGPRTKRKISEEERKHIADRLIEGRKQPPKFTRGRTNVGQR